MRRLRRWWTMRFRTTVRPGFYNPNGGKVLTEEEWAAQGSRIALVEGWHVERPSWWERGSKYGVTDATVEEARAELDEWMDDMVARDRTGASKQDGVV